MISNSISTFVAVFVFLNFENNYVFAQSESIVGKIIKQSGISSQELGIIITESSSSEDKVIFENRSNQMLVPASVTKIATTATILNAFPPGTKFKTELLASKPVVSSKMNGPLYFRGGGDPSFVSENLWFLVNQFVRSGVKVIEGDVIVDDSIFDLVRFDESRESNRVDRAYDAPVSGLSFNWNSVNIFVRPSKTGEPAKVFLDPENSLMKLENKVKTVSKGPSEVYAERKEDTILVHGKIKEGEKELVIYKNVTQPELWAGANLVEFLLQRGIQVKGQVRRGKTPPEAIVLASSDSKPIEGILTDMNKFSNNFVAEMLTKQLSVGKTNPATLQAGLQIIQQHLKQIGLSEDQFLIVNPSGLTRENRLTAKGLWKILHYLHQDFRLYPEFVSSLPIAGVDGTLKKRMRGENGERWVRAKTGFINGVVSLAGFAGRKNGQVLTFCFLYNGAGDETKVRSLFDKIINTLLE